MGTLLKDMPIHMERIDSNYSLLDEIKTRLEYDAQFKHKGSNDADIEISNVNELSNSVLTVITDFVNTNYEWKGAKA